MKTWKGLHGLAILICIVILVLVFPGAILQFFTGLSGVSFNPMQWTYMLPIEYDVLLLISLILSMAFLIPLLKDRIRADLFWNLLMIGMLIICLMLVIRLSYHVYYEWWGQYAIWN